MAFGKLLSDRVKKKRGSSLDSERYDYISLDNAEPDFGNPSSDNILFGSLQDGTRRFVNVDNTNGIEIPAGTNELQLTDTGVEAGDYGDEDNIPTFTVDAKGRLTTAATVPISLNTLSTDNLAEGSTNLYYTDTRVRSALSAQGDLSYDSATGVFSFDVEQVYTKANFDSDFNMAIDEALLGGTGLAYDATTNTLSIDSSELENYFKSDIREYFSADKGLVYNSSTGNFDIDSANIRTLFSGGTGITYTPATGVYDITNTGVIADTYGSASQVPVLKINAQGQIDSAGTVTVAGVSSVVFDSASFNYTINTADGGVFTKMIHTRKPGLAAGEHGSASKVPIITINEYGLVDSIGTTNVAGVSSTSFDSATGVYTINTADGNVFNTPVFTRQLTRGSLVQGLGVLYDSASGVISLSQDLSAASNVVFKSVTADSLSVDYINMNVNDSAPAYREGALWYDRDFNTLNYYGDDSNVIHNLGLEEHQRVYNNSGATINKGQPLYFSGNYISGTNSVPTVGLADATDVNAYNAQGIAAGPIPNNSYGYCLIAGQLFDVDTSHLNQNKNFFVGLGPGLTQNASPTYPNFPMCLGWVVRSDATNGILLVNQQNHSVNSFRVRTSAHIGNDLQIDGNLTVLGTQTTVSTADVTAGSPFFRLNEGNAIGEAGTLFTGTGLDDAFFAGFMKGPTPQTYYVRIDGVGTGPGGVDTFKVALGNDSAFSSPIITGEPITTDPQLIHSTDNISVEFGAKTGHTLNDTWRGTASPINVDTGFFTNRNTGSSGVGFTYMGIYYDVSDDKWRLVDEYDSNPAGTINTGDASFSLGDLVANQFEGNLLGNVTGNVTGNLTGNVTGQVSDISNFTTDDLDEGNVNQYYLKSRVDSDIAASLEDSGNVVNITINETIGSTVDSAYVVARVAGAPFLDSDDLYRGVNNIKADSATFSRLTVSGKNAKGIFGSFAETSFPDPNDRPLILVDSNATMLVHRIHPLHDASVEMKVSDSPGAPLDVYWDIFAKKADKSFVFRDRLASPARERIILTHSDSAANVKLGPTTSLVMPNDGKVINLRADSATIDNLYGTATNASRLNNEGPAYYLAYENFTGIPFVFDSNQTVEIVDSNLSFNGFLLRDAVRGAFGTDRDLEIYHDNADAYIDNDKGHLYIRNNVDDDDGSNIYIQAKSGENSILAEDDGTVRLYYDGGEKLLTSPTGIEISGTLNSHTIPGGAGTFALTSDLNFIDSALALQFLSTLDSSNVSTIISETVTNSFVDALNVDADTLDNLNSTQFLRSDAADTKTSGDLTFNDDVRASFGTGNDGSIRFNGTNLVINSTAGNISIQPPTSGGANIYSGAQFVMQADTNTVKLYSGGATKFFTDSYGATLNGRLATDSATATNINLPDGGDLKFGDGSSTGGTYDHDLVITHSGSSGTIQNNYGFLFIRNKNANADVIISATRTGNITDNYFQADASKKSAIMFYQGNQKITTTDSGVTVTGNILSDTAKIPTITLIESDYSDGVSTNGNFVLADKGTGRVDFGYQTSFGPAVEMYNKHSTQASGTRKGRIGFTYGGEDGLGDVKFVHRSSSTWTERAGLDAYGNFQMDGQLDADSATLNALTSTTSSLGTASANSLALASGQTVNEFSSDGTLAGASNSAVPTEAAVKTYVDGEIAGIGSFDSADVLTVEGTASFTGVSGDFAAGNTTFTTITLGPGNPVKLQGQEASTSSAASSVLFNLSTGLHDAFKLLIKAKRGNDRQVSELLVTTDGTTAVATEYGVVTTNGILANYEVAMNSNSIQLSVTPTSANTTTYKALYTFLET